MTRRDHALTGRDHLGVEMCHVEQLRCWCTWIPTTSVDRAPCRYTIDRPWARTRASTLDRHVVPSCSTLRSSTARAAPNSSAPPPRHAAAMTTPEALALMRRQAGAISRAQAAEVGLTDRQVQRLVRTGRWTRLLPGVYASAETTPRGTRGRTLPCWLPVPVPCSWARRRPLCAGWCPRHCRSPWQSLPGASAVGARRRDRAPSAWSASTSPNASA